MKPIALSEALVKFLGTEDNELPRSDVVKRIWDYIKQNNLQVYMFYLLIYVVSGIRDPLISKITLRFI